MEISPPSATSGPAKTVAPPRTFILSASLMLLVAVLVLILNFGQVRGLEFSPLTFQRRRITYYQLPLLGWQVSPVWREAATEPLETYLKQQALLPQRRVPNRWDLVWVGEGGGRHEGDPVALTRYLDTRMADQSQFWLDWTREHPQLAQTLWPLVQEAALLQAYVVIPELFEMARTASDEASFQRQTDQYMQQELIELADDLIAANLQDSARALDTALLARPNLDPQQRQKIEQRHGDETE